jgi:hypothetical protein
MTVKTILAFGMLTFVAQLLLGLAALVYGTTIVLPEIIHHSYTIYVIAPVLMAIGRISGDALAAYYLLIVVAIVASAVWLFLSSAEGYRKELTMKAEHRKHSALFDLCGLMFGVLFLNVVVVFVTGALWEDPLSPTEDMDLWELLFLLANASVWEEIIVRVLLIGLPLLLIDLARNKLQPKKYRYVLGGKFDLGLAEVSLILISSALFGFGHYDGWGAWKVFPSAIAGAAFGYMFMRHGLASAIMLHFGFDYLSIPTEVFSDGSGMSALVLLGFAVLAWLAMGAVFFVYYIIRMTEFVTKKRYFDERPSPPPMYPRPYPYYYSYGGTPPTAQWPPPRPPPQEARWQGPPRSGAVVSPAPSVSRGFFICPICGHAEARWIEGGKFQCLRCGGIS